MTVNEMLTRVAELANDSVVTTSDLARWFDEEDYDTLIDYLYSIGVVIDEDEVVHL